MLALLIVYAAIAIVGSLLIYATGYAIITSIFGEKEPTPFEDTEWAEQSTPMEWFIGNGFKLHSSEREEKDDDERTL